MNINCAMVGFLVGFQCISDYGNVKTLAGQTIGLGFRDRAAMIYLEVQGTKQPIVCVVILHI